MNTFQQRSNKLEVAQIFRQAYGISSSFSKLSPDKQRVVRAITSCRTAELGGHISCCNKCGHTEQSYNSCWNRHCPKCQGGAAFSWVESRRKDLLPVPYFHVVFTIPKELRDLCYQNKKIVYDILFRASSEALQDAARTKYNAKVGHFGVLHTWNQEMQYHPHAHQIVCGTGLSLDDTQAVPLGSTKFLLPVRVLSKLYRGKFIYYLKEAYRQSKLKFFNKLSSLDNPREFEHLCSKATLHDWVVYAKPPFGGPDQVLKYLAAYIHRVGISSARLRDITSQEVTFSARDKTRKGKKRAVTIPLNNFCQRFLLHLLPRGYKRVRYFGIFFNRNMKANISLIRSLLKVTPEEISKPSTTLPQTCPNCSCGLLKLSILIKPHRPIQKSWFPTIPFLNSA